MIFCRLDYLDFRVFNKKHNRKFVILLNSYTRIGTEILELLIVLAKRAIFVVLNYQSVGILLPNKRARAWFARFNFAKFGRRSFR